MKFVFYQLSKTENKIKKDYINHTKGRYYGFSFEFSNIIASDGLTKLTKILPENIEVGKRARRQTPTLFQTCTYKNGKFCNNNNYMIDPKLSVKCQKTIAKLIVKNNNKKK
jgi:hypothetical protein